MSLLDSIRRRKMFERSAERYQCWVSGQLQLCDSGVVFDGKLVNVSVGGAMFRPALAYLLSRKGGEVILRVGDLAVAGEIMGTTPMGYGLRFDAPLNDAVLRHVLEQQSAVSA